MECLQCRGDMVRSHSPFTMERRGYHIHWDAVPAWVCTQCGEPYFEAREVDLLQRAVSALERESGAMNAAG